MTHAANPFADPATPTLQDVLDRISSARSLPPRQQREILSAVNTAAVWFHRPPREIPANQDYLRRAFARLSHLTLGVGRGRFNNVRSLVKHGLKLAGVHPSGRSYLAPMTRVWERFLAGIGDPYTRQCLARFARFAGTQGLLPEQVDDDIVKRFHQALVDEDLTARPEVATQSAVRLWNRMVNETPGLGLTRLTPRLRRETYTLSWDQLPVDFVADVERHLSLLRWDDPTHALAPRRRLKPLSLKTRRYQILQLVSGLHLQGGNINDLRSLADLCQPDRVKQALSFFIERHRARHGADAEVSTSMIGGIADTIRSIAKHYAQVSEDVVRELTRISTRLGFRRCGMNEKNDKRLAQLDSTLVRRKLLRHAQTEMQTLAQKSSPTRDDAVRYSVLLAIEILTFAPMRIGNLAALDLDKHFVWPPGDRGDVRLTIPRGEVKNSQALEYKIPAGSVTTLQIYLRRFRPLLVTATSNALFPSWGGRSKRSDTVSKQISKLLHADLGIDWHPHLFRHLAALMYLEANPGDYEGARRLLGHKSMETTYRFYERVAMRSAVDRYDDLIEEARGPLPFVAARAPRLGTMADRVGR